MHQFIQEVLKYVNNGKFLEASASIVAIDKKPLLLYQNNFLLSAFKGWKVLFARQFKYDGP